MPQIGRTTQVVKTRQEIVAEGCKDVFSYLVKHKIDGHVGLQKWIILVVPLLKKITYNNNGIDTVHFFLTIVSTVI